MENITNSLLQTLEMNMNSSTKKSYERWEDYKKKGPSDQEKRRAEHLERQKQRRRDLVNQVRQLAQDVEEETSTNDEFKDVAKSEMNIDEKKNLQTKAEEKEEKRINYYKFFYFFYFFFLITFFFSKNSIYES